MTAENPSHDSSGARPTDERLEGRGPSGDEPNTRSQESANANTPQNPGTHSLGAQALSADASITHAMASTQQPTDERDAMVHDASSSALNASATESVHGERIIYRRRVALPVVLFFLTCLSTFFVGMTQWSPVSSLGDCTPALGEQSFSLTPLRQQFLTRWDEGLLYMFLVMLILFAHEMGHFIATLIYRVPASFPIFLPFPFNPLGTFGAVIGMQGSAADRKQIFDIGIAGPIAGLVFAVPIMWIGVMQLDLTTAEAGMVGFESPMATQWMLDSIQPEGYTGQRHVWISQLNPFFAAGWIGFLITGINMMPVSQLDGGHVTYTLFGKAAHWIARAMVTIAIAYMVFTSAPTMILMVVLLLLVGTDHPPTRNDKVKLGPFRTILGIASLSIPILCFPPLIFKW